MATLPLDGRVAPPPSSRPDALDSAQLHQILIIVPVLLFSVVAHEYAHGYAAMKQGDMTAYQLGRLTLNPIKHIDPFMTIIFPALLWLAHAPILAGAKPVPVNPRNYRQYKRGDIIVFRYPVDITMTFVKRAIGIPGDRIRLVNKQVYRNGVKLDEPYKVHKSDQIDPYRDNFPSEPNSMVYPGAMDMLQNHVVNGEVVVPPNSVFAMGDNRDSSLDSRYWGFVPRQNIIGKPLIIYWSYDAPTDQLQDPAIGLDHLKDLALNFFGKTRWRRTFMLIHGYYKN